MLKSNLVAIFAVNIQIFKSIAMIIDFTIENYKSIKEEQVFSMEYDDSDKDTNTNNLHTFQDGQFLKLAVVYGANASGKSNFIEAFRTLNRLILMSNLYRDLKIYYEPFEFDALTEKAPTKFEISFIHNKTKYEYHISYDATQVVEENLYFYPNGRKTKLFTRNKEVFDFGKELKGEKKTIQNITDRHQLFVSKGAENNMPQLKTVYNYFSDYLMVIPFLDSWVDSRYSERIAEELYNGEDENFNQNFNALIGSLDTGINEIEVEKVKNRRLIEYGGSTRMVNKNYRITTIHNYRNTDSSITQKRFELGRESTGTKKLFVIGGLILRALMNGRTIVIDEFERSLHHHISVFLMSLFNNPSINTKGAQLIVATHDTGLISKENKLRRDQIWFTEKNEYGDTELFCLSDVKGVRKNGPFNKWYLTSQLNAVPHITAFTFEENFRHG